VVNLYIHFNTTPARTKIHLYIIIFKN